MGLIDADRLFSERPEFRNPIHKENGEFNKGWNACINTFCDIIKEQPIAYDVDKVMNELLQNSELIDEFEEYSPQKLTLITRRIVGLNKAIDIMKRGGGVDE